VTTKLLEYGISHLEIPFLASSSEDETIKIWDLQTGECQKTLRIHRLYEGMNINQSAGLHQAQKETIIALGAY